MGVFAKLRKATVSPFVRVEQFGFHVTNFHDIFLYWELLLKSVGII